MKKCRANLFLALVSVVIQGVFFAAVAKDIYLKKASLYLAEVLVLGALFLAWLLFLAYLAVLRVELSIDSIAYQNLFRGRHVILRDEISSVINERHESETTTYVLLVTPRVGSGKSPIKIPLFSSTYVRLPNCQLPWRRRNATPRTC